MKQLKQFLACLLAVFLILPPATATAVAQTGTVNGQPANVAGVGTAGAAATLSIATPTTGAAGTSVSCTNTGTSTNAVLSCTIPKGADGTSNVPNLDVQAPTHEGVTGKTYYVSSRIGSDTANNGLSATAPYATCSKAAGVAAAGDRILFEYGSFFYVTATCTPKSGTSNTARTVWDAYGDARLPLPLFDGAAVVSLTWSVNGTYSTVYQAANTATLSKMFVDNQKKQTQPLLPVNFRGTFCTSNSSSCTYAVGDVVTYTDTTLNTTDAYIANKPSQYSDNGWHFPGAHTTNPYPVYDNNGYWTKLPALSGGGAAGNNLQALSVAPGHAYSDGTNWYVNLLDGSAPSAHLLEADTSTSPSVILGGGNIGHIAMRHLAVERAYASCIAIYQSSSDVNGLNVQAQDILLTDNQCWNWGVPGGGNNSGIFVHGYNVTKYTAQATWASGATSVVTTANSSIAVGMYLVATGIPTQKITGKTTSGSQDTLTFATPTTAANTGTTQGIAATSWPANTANTGPIGTPVANPGYTVALNVHFVPWQAPGGECLTGCSNLDADMQYGIPGVDIERNTVGMADVNPTLRYHSSGISMEGAIDGVIRGNTVATYNAMCISGDAYYFGSGNVRGIIDQNDCSNSQGGVQNNYSAGEDSPGARYTAGPSLTARGMVVQNNTLHTLYGFAIGNGTSVNWVNFDNKIWDMYVSFDRKLYNAEDCNGTIPFLAAGQNAGGWFIGNKIISWSSSAITLEAAGQSCSNTFIAGNTILWSGTNTNFLGMAPATRNSSTISYPDEMVYFASGTTPTFGPNVMMGGPVTEFRVNFTNSGDDSFRQTFATFLSAYPGAGTLVSGTNYIAPSGGGGGSSTSTWFSGCTMPTVPNGNGGPWMLGTYGALNASPCPQWVNINNYVIQGEENVTSSATSLFQLNRYHNVSLASGANWTGWTWATPTADGNNILAWECIYLKQPSSGTVATVTFPSNVLAPTLPTMQLGHMYTACFNYSPTAVKWVPASNWVDTLLP